MKRGELLWLGALFLLLFGYQYALSHVDGLPRLIGDEKGLSGILLYFPFGCYLSGLIGAYRWGFRIYRCLLVGLVATAAFLAAVPSSFDLATPSEWWGVAFYVALYTLPALVGEVFGALVRHWSTPRRPLIDEGGAAHQS